MRNNQLMVSGKVLAVAVLSLIAYVVQAQEKPKNIILMIGDGMAMAQIQAAMAVADNTLFLEEMKHIGFTKTHSADNYITDSAAGATAIATGTKTDNGKIAVDPSGEPLKTILEYAEENSYATGLVSTSSILHATPASFIAHHPDRHEYKHIAPDFLDTDIDLFIGGGKETFENAADGRNLIEELIAKDYTIVESMAQLSHTPSKKFAALLADKHMPSMGSGRGDYLRMASKKAVEVLSQNEKGFFLMIEGSQIDWGGHDNSIEYVTSEMIDFDNTIGAMLEFARNNRETLLIVASDHETGGLTLYNEADDDQQVKPQFTSTKHTGIMVPVFSFGPGAGEFTGIYDNTDLFFKMMEMYGF